MKRILIILLVLVMLFCACSCNSNNYGNTQTQATTQKQPESLKILSEFIDMDSYSDVNFVEGSKNDFYLSLEKKTSYVFDGTITISGAEITLPIKYQDINKLGWSLAPEDNDAAETSIKTHENVSMMYPLFNEKGEEIYVSISSNSGKKTSINDCIIEYISIGDYESFDKSDSLVPFDLSSGISDKSNYSDVISKIGLPNRIDCFLTEEGKTLFSFEYYCADKNNEVDFMYTGEEDMSYYVRTTLVFAESGEMTNFDYTISQ